MLANAVHSGNGLQLDCGVDERLAEEDMRGVDEVQTGRMRFGM